MTAVSGPSIVTNGLIMYLDAANTRSYPGSGTNWNDLSGTGRNVTTTGSPTFGSSGGGSFTFDGSTQQLSSVSLDNPTGGLTSQIVMNYTNTGAYHNLFDRSSSSPMFWIRPTGLIELNASALVSSAAYNGQTIVATATFSTSVPGLQLFINGRIVHTVSTAQTSWTNPFTITLLNRGNAGRFNGILYSMAFYNRVLTSTEVEKNFNAVRGRYGI